MGTPPLDDIAGMQLMQVWNGVVARTVHGERLSLAVVELEPNTVVPEHSHENEQLGLVLSGTVSFRVGTETRELGPGGTWRIPSNTPHEVHTGPDGRGRRRRLRSRAGRLGRARATRAAGAGLALRATAG